MFATILKLFWHSFGILWRSFRNSFPILFRFSCNLFAQKNTHDVAKTQHTWCCNYFAQFCAIIGKCHCVYLPGLCKQFFSFLTIFLLFFFIQVSEIKNHWKCSDVFLWDFSFDLSPSFPGDCHSLGSAILQINILSLKWKKVQSQIIGKWIWGDLYNCLEIDLSQTRRLRANEMYFFGEELCST